MKKISDRLGNKKNISEAEIKKLLTSEKKSDKNKLQEIILDSTDIKLYKTKTGKRKYSVYDRLTGKKLSVVKFRKYMDIDKAMSKYILTEKFEEQYEKNFKDSGLRINDFLQTITESKNFRLYLKIEDIEPAISGKQIVFNGTQVTKSEFFDELLEYENEFDFQPLHWGLRLIFESGTVEIELDEQIKEWINEESENDKSFAFTDTNQNWVVLKSA